MLRNFDKLIRAGLCWSELLASASIRKLQLFNSKTSSLSSFNFLNSPNKSRQSSSTSAKSSSANASSTAATFLDEREKKDEKHRANNINENFVDEAFFSSTILLLKQARNKQV
jgi:hypothetical protein